MCDVWRVIVVELLIDSMILFTPLQEIAEDLHSIDSCEYIWEAGVGFAHSPPHSHIHDLNR